MTQKAETLLVALVYSAIVLGIMALSGKTSEKTLYDRYLVSVEGIVVPISDYNSAVKFYTEVLDFIPIHANDNPTRVIGFRLANSRKLLFSLREHLPNSADSLPPLLVIKVRNGFEKLHRALAQRSDASVVTVAAEDFNELIPPSRVTQIVERSWGGEFVVTDPDGNRLLFYQPTQQSASRF